MFTSSCLIQLSYILDSGFNHYLVFIAIFDEQSDLLMLKPTLFLSDISINSRFGIMLAFLFSEGNH